MFSLCDFTFLLTAVSARMKLSNETHLVASLAEAVERIVLLVVAFDALPVVGGPELEVDGAVRVLAGVG